jgi:hypothetical protein
VLSIIARKDPGSYSLDHTRSIASLATTSLLHSSFPEFHPLHQHLTKSQKQPHSEDQLQPVSMFLVILLQPASIVLPTQSSGIQVLLLVAVTHDWSGFLIFSPHSSTPEVAGITRRGQKHKVQGEGESLLYINDVNGTM